MRSIPEAKLSDACEAIESAGLCSSEDFVATCRASLGKLENAIAKKNSLSTKNARSEMEKALAGIMVESVKAPTLVRKKTLLVK